MCVSGPMSIWFPVITLYYPKAAISVQFEKVLLQVQLKYKFRANTLRVRSTILQDAVYALNLRPPCGTVSPVGRMHGYESQGVEARLAPLSIFPTELPRWTLCFSLLNSGLWRGRGSSFQTECALNKRYSQRLVVLIDVTATWEVLILCV